MYLGQKSIFCLDAFISGWSFAQLQGNTDVKKLSEFSRWLASKNNFKHDFSYVQILVALHIDVGVAFDEFFVEYREWMNAKPAL